MIETIITIGLVLAVLLTVIVLVVKSKKSAKEIFDNINNFIRGTEASVVNVISAISPWGAPVPVAYMTYEHCFDALGFPSWVALITALVVEALGISSISTALSFWEHNKKYKEEKDQAPLTLAIVTFVFYISVVLTMNVVLDIEKSWTDKTITWGIIAALALLTLFSVPAGVILAIRAQQTEIINTLETESAKEDIDSSKNQADKKAQDEQNRLDTLAREERERADARQRRLDEQENERLILVEQAKERERLAEIEADLKAKKAAIRKGIYQESSTKVSESFDNSADESFNFANFPRNWRKMTVEHKQTLAILISEKSKEDVATTMNVSTRTVENWTRDLTTEGYLQ